MTLQYLTHAAVEELRQAVPSRLDWYYGDDLGELTHGFSVSKPRRSADIDFTSFGSRLQSGPGRTGEQDAANAMVVYTALSRLTRHQAADDRLWTYLTHFECPDYVSDRWLRRRDRPDDDEAAARRVLQHFMVSDVRSLIRDNGVSRLYWLGRVAHEVDEASPERFLEVLLYLQDVRSALIERPAVSMNTSVLRVIYRVMLEDFEDGKALFTRITFREWMKNLNRRGGVILLDALDDVQLEELLRCEADRALEASR